MTILGIDLGARRIGLAVSSSGTLASPHSVMANEGDVAAKLARVASELEAETIVLGIPKRARTRDGEAKYEELAADLRQRTCKEVVLWDETLSTVEAYDHLRSSGRKRRDAQKDIDMYAAAVILQSYLDGRGGRTS